MKLIDMHCDTISELYKKGRCESFMRNHLCVDIEKLQKAESQAQFLACFVNGGKSDGKKDRWEKGFKAVLSMIERIHEEERENLRCIRYEKELEENRKNDCISGIITVEEGGILNGKIERIDCLYEKGVRLITLTWNYENCIGYPNSKKKNTMERGLKPFGKIVVERLNEKGIIVDVSHLSDGGFWDCIKYSRAPIVASHSNARALCPHPRNLSDEMLRRLGDSGGVAGVNFYSHFLTEKGNASVEHIAQHALYMMQHAGEEAVAFGTDFDGFERTELPEGIAGIQDIGYVCEVMKNKGFSERQLDKIWYKNVKRILHDVWKSK